MAKMKLYVLQRLIDRGRKPEQSVTTQLVAPMEVKEHNVANAGDDFAEKVEFSVLQTALRLSEVPPG